MKKYETNFECECGCRHLMDTLSEYEWCEVRNKVTWDTFIILPNHNNPNHRVVEKTDRYWITVKEDEDTMKNIYVLKVKDDTLRILFTDSIVDNKGYSQRVTVCGIREGETSKEHTYWGNTIQNPRDADNTYRARQVAFRKAFVNFAQKRGRLNLNDDGSNLREYPALNDLYDKLRFDLYWQGAWEGK